MHLCYLILIKGKVSALAGIFFDRTKKVLRDLIVTSYTNKGKTNTFCDISQSKQYTIILLTYEQEFLNILLLQFNQQYMNIDNIAAWMNLLVFKKFLI